MTSAGNIAQEEKEDILIQAIEITMQIFEERRELNRRAEGR